MYKKTISKSLGLLITLLITIAIVIISYASYITYAANQRTISTLSEISHQNQIIFSLEIERDAKIIENAASYIEKLGYASFDDILTFLKHSQIANQQHLLGIVTPDGKLTDINGVEIDLSQFPNTKEAFNSEETKFFCDSYNDFTFLVCTTPIRIDGENKFVIFSTYLTSRYADSISTPTFENEGYSYVIDSDGKRIVGSSHDGSFGLTFDNLFDEMSQASSKNDSAIQQMQADLKEGKSDGIIMLNGIEKYIYYTPLNINDWYILTVVPKTVVTKYTTQILICCYLFIVFCLILFFYLLYTAIKAKTTGQKQLEEMAYVDSLTGGMSYTKFVFEAEKILKDNPDENYALINLDINNFQYINDFFGDDEGDRALKFLWSAIYKRLEPKELCSRIFDDHFVALITYDNTKSLDNACADFFNSLKLYSPADGVYNMTVSVGIYLVDDRNMNINSMLNRARTTQKHLKGQSSQSQYAIYSPKQRDDIMMQKTIENGFEDAIKNKEFKVYFQPKFNINANKFNGAEALVRWQKPDGTIISPGMFIPLFEKNGDIVKLDKYVLEETCAKIRKWLDLGYDVSPISVNVSLLQLLDENFVEDHIKTVEKYGIPLNLIEVEFTESILAENESLLISLTKQCKKHGIKVLLDDFGSGYSSLNMLNLLPCDIVKLDKYVLEETCAKIRKWLDLGYDVSPISVNVSLLQLLDENFVEDHIKTVEKYGIPLNLIEVEFTESILAENESLLISLTKQCKKHGIKVLLDDFGSGYSSLNMLNLLPCDIVKLDKRFVDKLETDDKSKAIVLSAISLAHTLQMSVTAEGIETKSQYDLLKEMHCDTIQGFYCAKPMPEKEYENLIKG